MNPSSRQVLGPFLLGVLALTGCVIPTFSLHSFRDVAITLSEADSGKPVASLPFWVHYEYYPADSPIFYHLELRTPKEVRAKTDEAGKVVVKLADYAWETLLEVDDRERGYVAIFVLSKESVRKGGAVEPLRRDGKYPRLRLELQPVKRPNKTTGAKAQGRASRLAQRPSFLLAASARAG